nr:protein O-mannosyl-transferase TMTC1-like [Cherax quadricarinatus]
MHEGGAYWFSCHNSPKNRKKSTLTSSHAPSSWPHDRSYGREDPPATWLYLTVWLAGVLVYVNGLTGDFVHDDVSAIKTNPDVLGTNPLHQIFFNDYWGKAMSDPLSHKSYRPFTILTFRINHLLFGLRPVLFHAVNLLLHSCVCVLLTRLLLRLLRLPQGTVLSAALIFATHPVHTEAVTGLVGRADLLAALAFLASIFSYHSAIETDRVNPNYEDGIDDEGESAGEGGGGEGRSLGSGWENTRREIPGIVREGIGDGGEGEREGGEGNKEWVWVQRAGMVTGVGTLCKEPALTALLACAAWDVILHRKHVRRLFGHQSTMKHLRPLVRRLSRLCLMGAVILVFRLWMLRGASPIFSDQDNPASFSPSFLTRLLTFLYLPAFNAWLLVCPWRLAHDWQMGSIPLVTSFTDLRLVASIAFYAAILLILRAGCLLKGREGQALLLGWSLLVLPFLPATNLLFPVGFVVAERILYIPSVQSVMLCFLWCIPSLGYSVLVSVGMSRVGRLRAPCLLLLLLVFSCRTVHRNRDWESRETLFLSGLRTLPHNAKMHYNFANLQKDLGNTDLAKFHYTEAIRLWPRHSSAHNNLGTLVKNTSQAEKHFWLALKAHPRHSHAFYNLAHLRQQQGRVGEAVALLEESLRYDSTNTEAVSILAGLYRDTGRYTEAENLHLSLLAARSTDPAVYNNYAAFLQKSGRGEAALQHYQTALLLDPQHRETLVNTATLLATLHRNNQAEMLYKRALAVSWEAETGESLGKLYLNTGRLEEAESAFRTVLTHHPESLSSRVYLAQVKQQQRCYLQSEELLQQVLSRDPAHLEALFQLSLALHFH